MALFPKQGSSLSTSLPTVEPPLRVNTGKSFDQRLLDKSYTHNTFVNKTALNTDRLDPRIRALSAFVAGRPIAVTYYSQRHNYTAKKSNIADFALILDKTHRVLVKINDLELRLSGEFDVAFDEETNETTVAGKGMVFPEFTVNIGDVFLYEALPGQLCLFVVNSISPMSWHRQAVQEIGFFMKEFVTNERLHQIEECTIETYYFDKQRTWDGASLVLNRDDHITLRYTVRARGELVKYIMQNYYQKDARSLFRPDGVYDPYALMFFRALISTADTYEYPPLQLWPEKKHKGCSIWTKLLFKDSVFASVVKTHAITQKCQYSILSTGTNSLHGKLHVELADPEQKDATWYGVSEAYYLQDLTNLSPVEQQLHSYMTTGHVVPDTLIAWLKSEANQDPVITFYEHLLTLFLFNIVIKTI